MGVVGDRMGAAGECVKRGDLWWRSMTKATTGVRASIVAMKPLNGGGAKGGRKVDAGGLYHGT